MPPMNYYSKKFENLHYLQLWDRINHNKWIRQRTYSRFNNIIIQLSIIHTREILTLYKEIPNNNFKEQAPSLPSNTLLNLTNMEVVMSYLATLDTCTPK